MSTGFAAAVKPNSRVRLWQFATDNRKLLVDGDEVELRQPGTEVRLASATIVLDDEPDDVEEPRRRRQVLVKYETRSRPGVFYQGNVKEFAQAYGLPAKGCWEHVFHLKSQKTLHQIRLEIAESLPAPLTPTAPVPTAEPAAAGPSSSALAEYRPVAAEHGKLSGRGSYRQSVVDLPALNPQANALQEELNERLVAYANAGPHVRNVDDLVAKLAKRPEIPFRVKRVPIAGRSVPDALSQAIWQTEEHGSDLMAFVRHALKKERAMYKGVLREVNKQASTEIKTRQIHRALARPHTALALRLCAGVLAQTHPIDITLIQLSGRALLPDLYPRPTADPPAGPVRRRVIVAIEQAGSQPAKLYLLHPSPHTVHNDASLVRHRHFQTCLGIVPRLLCVRESDASDPVSLKFEEVDNFGKVVTWGTELVDKDDRIVQRADKPFDDELVDFEPDYKDPLKDHTAAIVDAICGLSSHIECLDAQRQTISRPVTGPESRTLKLSLATKYSDEQHEQLRSMWTRLWDARQFNVAIVGSSGAGKSTLSTAINKEGLPKNKETFKTVMSKQRGGVSKTSEQKRGRYLLVGSTNNADGRRMDELMTELTENLKCRAGKALEGFGKANVFPAQCLGATSSAPVRNVYSTSLFVRFIFKPSSVVGQKMESAKSVLEKLIKGDEVSSYEMLDWQEARTMVGMEQLSEEDPLRDDFRAIDDGAVEDGAAGILERVSAALKLPDEFSAFEQLKGETIDFVYCGDDLEEGIACIHEHLILYATRGPWSFWGLLDGVIIGTPSENNRGYEMTDCTGLSGVDTLRQFIGAAPVERHTQRPEKAGLEYALGLSWAVAAASSPPLYQPDEKQIHAEFDILIHVAKNKDEDSTLWETFRAAAARSIAHPDTVKIIVAADWEFNMKRQTRESILKHYRGDALKRWTHLLFKAARSEDQQRSVEDRTERTTFSEVRSEIQSEQEKKRLELVMFAARPDFYDNEKGERPDVKELVAAIRKHREAVVLLRLTELARTFIETCAVRLWRHLYIIAQLQAVKDPEVAYILQQLEKRAETLRAHAGSSSPVEADEADEEWNVKWGELEVNETASGGSTDSDDDDSEDEEEEAGALALADGASKLKLRKLANDATKKCLDIEIKKLGGRKHFDATMRKAENRSLAEKNSKKLRQTLMRRASKSVIGDALVGPVLDNVATSLTSVKKDILEQHFNDKFKELEEKLQQALEKGTADAGEAPAPSDAAAVILESVVESVKADVMAQVEEKKKLVEKKLSDFSVAIQVHLDEVVDRHMDSESMKQSLFRKSNLEKVKIIGDSAEELAGKLRRAFRSDLLALLTRLDELVSASLSKHMRTFASSLQTFDQEDIKAMDVKATKTALDNVGAFVAKTIGRLATLFGGSADSEFMGAIGRMVAGLPRDLVATLRTTPGAPLLTETIDRYASPRPRQPSTPARGRARPRDSADVESPEDKKGKKPRKK